MFSAVPGGFTDQGVGFQLELNSVWVWCKGSLAMGFAGHLAPPVLWTAGEINPRAYSCFLLNGLQVGPQVLFQALQYGHK